jgi:GTP1/Obg family GTP-binding protein
MRERYLVFTGRPNAGKSSIIREVAGLDVAKYAADFKIFIESRFGAFRYAGVW